MARLFYRRLFLVLNVYCGSLWVAGFAVAQDAFSLRFAVEEARVNEARHRLAQASFRADIEVLPQAQAGLRPDVSVSHSRTSNQLGARFSNGQSSSLDYYSGSTSLVARQPLYRPEAWSRLNQAQSEVIRLESVLLTDRNRVMVDTTAAYLELLRSDAEWRYGMLVWQAAQAQWDAARRGVELGLVSATDREDRRGRAELAKLRVQQLNAKKIDALRKLEVLTGRKVNSVKALGEAIKPATWLVLPDIATLSDKAVNEAPVVRAALAGVASAQFGIDRAQAMHQPTLDLVASRSKSSSDTFNSINSTYRNTAVTVQLNLPLYAGGRYSSVERQAAAQLEQAQAQFALAQSDTTIALEHEYQISVQLAQRLETHEALVSAATDLLTSMTAGVARGTKSRLDVLEATAGLGNARYEQTNAFLELLMSHVRLESFLGPLDDVVIDRLDQLLQTPVLVTR